MSKETTIDDVIKFAMFASKEDRERIYDALCTGRQMSDKDAMAKFTEGDRVKFTYKSREYTGIIKQKRRTRIAVHIDQENTRWNVPAGWLTKITQVE